ncbi:MAG: quinoprotein dehydrogenase-associated putative ABC transporter substrate-binding protein [Gammaproteobacteria bacterium]|nr:quinoprotein dehydrogenase-associated putative ABC transporter substrate-binding protein [Gammaproteobacteria bacterium]
MNGKFRLETRLAAAAAILLASLGVARASSLDSLTVCADPGNMPLSNDKGQGFENKIAEVLGKALGTGVSYYWRPSIERGLMRTTLSAGNCDVWMDMTSDTEGAQILRPLYRSTFVFVYRKDKGIHIGNFDDPQLKKLRIGVYQISAMREVLLDHGVVANTVVHYLSHDADLVKTDQPSYQVREVIDGDLDVAGVWGPMAGYYAKIEHAPIVLQPVNLMEDQVPLEFDMSLAVPKGRPDIEAAIDKALVDNRDEIRKILVDYGVPLVKCGECLISGDLPSHGPYHPVHEPEMTPRMIAELKRKRMAELKQWLAQGADPDRELQNAITADDLDRVRYLIKVGAHVDKRDGDGYTPLINATRFGFTDIAAYLVAHKADVDQRDADGWTALLYAAWDDDARAIRFLIAHGAHLDAADADGRTPLAVAAQNAKPKALAALVVAGANVNAPIAKGGYTPLMLASISGSPELVRTLLRHGANVNAVNPGGVSALMIAAANNHPELVEILLKAGADLNAHSSDGRTAISIARAQNNDAVLKVLEVAARGRSGRDG